MPIRKLITEDIVEIRDAKITLTSPHGPIFVNIGDRLRAALPKVSDQSLSIAQKISLDQAITVPGLDNPVVYRNDLDQYVPAVSVGHFRDSVASYSDLPISGNTLGDLRAVIDEGNIYRWSDDLEWVEFLLIGTLAHSLLINQNSSVDFQHITATEKSNLIGQTHTHENKAFLDQITSLGSGKVITEEERLLLPSELQKAALVGSAFVPDVINRFVTSQDPRLNTLKNPYITLGLNGTLASYQGEDISKLIEALNALDGDSIVRALEILPGYYQPNFDNDSRPLVWSDANIVEVKHRWDPQSQQVVAAPLPYRQIQNNGLLFESLALRSTILKFECFQPALQLVAPGESQATVRGLIFEIRSSGTEGIKIDRANTLIDECTFRTAPGALLSHGLKGITVNAPNCVIRRCIFEGLLSEGLVINSENTRIEECQFNLSSSDSSALRITENGDFTISNNCAFYRGSVVIDSGALSNLFTSCVHNDSSPFIDSGTATRWLSNRNGRYQQAYIGKTRTIGGPHSFADFCGSDETPFVQAFADPYTKEVIVLSDSVFSFNDTVTVPFGVKVRGGDNTIASIIAPNEKSAFLLSSHTTLEYLSISGTGSNLIHLEAAAQRCRISRSSLSVTSSGYYAVVSPDGSTELQIDSCSFTGSRGISLTFANRAVLENNHFGTVGIPVSLSEATNCQVRENIFYSSAPSVIVGTGLTVEGNNFIGAVPSKTQTVDSVWQANWPHPLANNQDGHDYLRLSLNDALSPVLGSGSSFALSSGLRLLAFEKAGSGTSVTMPQKLSSKLNRNLGFSVHIYWTSVNIFSGSVLWEVTVAFRDRAGQDYGSSVTKVLASPRTQRLFVKEELAILAFTSSDYGYLAGVDITHYSIVIRRLADNPLDTMPGTAFLTEAQIILPRD